MGALLGVARGSHEPPKFIIFEYNGAKKKDERPVVLIGKTITFDTGGISLKPAENMEHMKADMTGGAEVLASIRAAARLKLPLHLDQHSAGGGKYAGRSRHEAGRYRDDPFRKNRRSAEYRCGGAADSFGCAGLCTRATNRRR